MRVTTAFKRLLDLPGVTVSEVVFQPSQVVVTVRLRSRRLCCPDCGFSTKARYDTRPVTSTWRHLDLGRWRLEVRADLRRLACPTHGTRTEGVPFARSGSRFTKDFEDLVGWLATTMDKTALCRLVRIDWATTGRIIERVMETGLDPDRLDKLFVAGVDEVSWRKGHAYVLVTWNQAAGLNKPSVSHELRGQMRLVDSSGGEVASARPTRASGGVVGDLGGPWTGAKDDRCLCEGAG